MDGTTNIVELKGIGEKSATAFGRLGIRDVDSLITMYPKYYLTYEDPKDVNEIEIGQRVSIFVRINSEVHIQYAKRMKIVTCTAKDHTGTIMLVWYNMPYLRNNYIREEIIYLRELRSIKMDGSRWNIQRSLHRKIMKLNRRHCSQYIH